MKAIFIDTKNKELKEVNIDPKNTLHDWYELIGCQLVEAAVEIETNEHHGNTIMVDEEGMLSLNKDSRFFTYAGGHQPFAGNGLIVGINYDNGETIDVSLTLNDLKDKINFYSLSEVQALTKMKVY